MNNSNTSVANGLPLAQLNKHEYGQLLLAAFLPENSPSLKKMKEAQTADEAASSPVSVISIRQEDEVATPINQQQVAKPQMVVKSLSREELDAKKLRCHQLSPLVDQTVPFFP